MQSSSSTTLCQINTSFERCQGKVTVVVSESERSIPRCKTPLITWQYLPQVQLPSYLTTEANRALKTAFAPLTEQQIRLKLSYLRLYSRQKTDTRQQFFTHTNLNYMVSSRLNFFLGKRLGDFWSCAICRDFTADFSQPQDFVRYLQNRN